MKNIKDEIISCVNLNMTKIELIDSIANLVVKSILDESVQDRESHRN